MKSLSEPLDYGNPQRHHIQYCGKSFTVNGKKFTYLRGDFNCGESVIIFTDGKYQYEKREADFFNRVNWMDLKG